MLQPDQRRDADSGLLCSFPQISFTSPDSIRGENFTHSTISLTPVLRDTISPERTSRFLRSLGFEGSSLDLEGSSLGLEGSSLGLEGSSLGLEGSSAKKTSLSDTERQQEDEEEEEVVDEEDRSRYRKIQRNGILENKRQKIYRFEYQFCFYFAA